MGSWSKLLTLSSREKGLLAASLVVLPINGLALQLMSLNRWRSVLSRLAPAGQGSEVRGQGSGVRGQRSEVSGEAHSGSLLDSVSQTARMVRVAASRGPYRGNCLRQSLTLWWLLSRQKIESDIRFGARIDGGKFEAHAWVEFEGLALNEGPDIHHRFKRFEPAVALAEAKTR